MCIGYVCAEYTSSLGFFFMCIACLFTIIIWICVVEVWQSRECEINVVVCMFVLFKWNIYILSLIRLFFFGILVSVLYAVWMWKLCTESVAVVVLTLYFMICVLTSWSVFIYFRPFSSFNCRSLCFFSPHFPILASFRNHVARILMWCVRRQLMCRFRMEEPRHNAHIHTSTHSDQIYCVRFHLKMDFLGTRIPEHKAQKKRKKNKKKKQSSAK